MAEIAASLPDFTNNVVDDRYKLVQMLGSGACGVVYKALDMHTSSDTEPKYRAVKLVPKRGRTREQRAAIRREVELHSVVSSHPNVVTMHDAYDDDDYFYIILDYLSGGDLFGQICETQAYAGNDETLRSAFLSLIDAVQACHDAQIAHRDLKPENVLTSADGTQAYLADFGLASAKRTCEDFAVGTYIYMAPECYGPKAWCPRTSDVWALGVILFNMITGINPWERAALKDRCYKRFLADPNYLYDRLPISAGAHQLVLRALAFNPLRRITLPELRAAVAGLDTFFRPREAAPVVPAVVKGAGGDLDLFEEGAKVFDIAFGDAITLVGDADGKDGSKFGLCDSRSVSSDFSYAIGCQ